MEISWARSELGRLQRAAYVKASNDCGTYSAAQPDAAAKNMMFASVDSQQACCEHAMNMFRCRALLPQNEPKIVGFQDEHKGIPSRRMLVRPSRSGSLCHKHFFSNSRTSCSWLPWRLCRRTRSIVCTGLYEQRGNGDNFNKSVEGALRPATNWYDGCVKNKVATFFSIVWHFLFELKNTLLES